MARVKEEVKVLTYLASLRGGKRFVMPAAAMLGLPDVVVSEYSISNSVSMHMRTFSGLTATACFR